MGGSEDWGCRFLFILLSYFFSFFPPHIFFAETKFVFSGVDAATASSTPAPAALTGDGQIRGDLSAFQAEVKKRKRSAAQSQASDAASSASSASSASAAATQEAEQPAKRQRAEEVPQR